MAVSELSDTSDEEALDTLTPAEKGRRTRAANLARQQEEAAELAKATQNGRAAKNSALKKKIWDTSRSREIKAANATGRKRAASTATGDQPPKKSKSKAPSDDSDEMDVGDPDQVTVAAVAKSRKVVATKPDQMPGRKTFRKYVPTAILSDNDEAAPQVSTLAKTRSRKATSNPGTAPIAPSVRQPPRHKKPATTSDGEGSNDGAALSPEEDGDADNADNASQSSADDGSIGDLLNERPRLMEQNRKSAAAPEPMDDLLDFSDNAIIPKLPTRRYSSSSFGSGPPDTDLDLDYGNIPPETDFDPGAADNDESELEMIKEKDQSPRFPSPERVVEKPKKKKAHMKVTAQQAKYNEETPAIRSKNKLHDQPEPKLYQEAEWDKSARIQFPAEGGNIRLRDQAALLRGVIKDAIDLHLFEIGFKSGYDDGASRSAFSSRLLRLSAKKNPAAIHIEKRAKKDSKFCTRLAPLICARGGNLRTELRASALSKVATHYELNKPGVTPSQVRGMVKQLLENQSFIFPYTSPPPPPPPPSAPTEPPAPADGASAASGAASAQADVIIPNTVKSPKIVKAFDWKAPFFAPAITDVIHEVWWNNSKALGPTHVKHLKSHRDDRPNEVVLPDAMICLAGANIRAALQAYSTGQFVPPPEFNQARLEGTYQSLVDTLVAQRAGRSAKVFNKLMHDLYLKASQSSAPTAASGSANNMILLDIDSD